MDHFKVAKFRIAKNPKKPNAPGKLTPLDLSSRIDKFIAATGTVIHKDHLHALRIVGNLGTHKNVLGRTELLDAFEVYEHALEELVGKKSAQIAKLAKKLSKHTGMSKRVFPLFKRRMTILVAGPTHIASGLLLCRTIGLYRSSLDV